MGVYEDDSGNQHVSIQLSWTAASPADLDLSEYVVAWSQDNSDWQEMSVERTATSCRVFGLELGGGYYFRIKAVDRAGNESAWVNFNAGAIITMPSDTTAPSAPTGLTSYSRFKAVRLGWTNPTQKDLSHIIVHRSTDRDTDQDGTHDLVSAGGANDKLAVQFTANTSIDITIISLKLQRTGTPGGNIRVVVYDNAAGLPNAAIADGASDWLAASDVGAAMGWEEFVFSTLPSITVTSIYHIVLEADGAYTYVGGVDEVTWGIESVGSGGTFEAYGGAAWTNVTTEMGTFVVLNELVQIDSDGYTDEIGLWDSTFEYTIQAVDHVGNASVPATIISGNTDITAPAAPTNLSSSEDTVTDADGHIIPYINLTWTDSATEDVQAHEVEIWYDLDDDASYADEDPLTFRCLGTPLRLSPVPGDIDYRVRVRALDDANLPSAWTGYETGTTAKDNVAPGAPDPPTMLAVLKGIRMTVDKPGEGDWAGTEYYVSTSQGFTPGAATLKASGRFTSYTYETTVYVNHYVRVRHYDSSGNYSGYCAEGSALPTKVQDTDIPDGEIPNAKIVDIAATKITGQVVNAQILDVHWGKLTNIQVQNADIVNLACDKLLAGTITAAISIQSAGTIGFVNGPDLSGSGGNLTISAAVTCTGSLQAASLRGDGGFYVGEAAAISGARNANLAAVTADSCSLIAHGGFGFPDVRVPTSKGLTRLTAIESPAFLFLDVHDGVDPLLKEICEGKVWVAPLYEWCGKETKLEGKPDKLLVLASRKGYADVRFELVSEQHTEAKPSEAPDHSIEHSRERDGHQACQHQGRDRRGCLN